MYNFRNEHVLLKNQLMSSSLVTTIFNNSRFSFFYHIFQVRIKDSYSSPGLDEQDAEVKYILQFPNYYSFSTSQTLTAVLINKNVNRNSFITKGKTGCGVFSLSQRG